MSNSSDPHGPPARLLCPWGTPGKNTRVGWHFLLQGIFPTQESNPSLLPCRQIVYQQSYNTRFLSQLTLLCFFKKSTWNKIFYLMNQQSTKSNLWLWYWQNVPYRNQWKVPCKLPFGGCTGIKKYFLNIFW